MRQQLFRLLSRNIENSPLRVSVSHRALAMARMPLYSLSSSSSIPDSEPERTQIRTKIGISSQIPLDLDVIEIMDSDSEPGTPSGESPQVDEVLAPRFEYASIAASQPLAPRISSPLVAMNLVSSLPLDVLIAPTSEGDSANHISPRPARALQISHLAFASKHAPKSSTSRLPSTSRDTLPVPDIPKKKPASSRLKKALSELSPDFTEGEIEHVLKCIACDARWTARKSAAQKVQHMRMCCKKAFYTQETIDVLLRKAIQDAAEAPPKPNKTPAAAGPPPASPTLFTEFNPAEAKKKRGRAATIKTTVTSVLDTRSEILNRAQLFLQQDSESPEGREAAPLVTQQFGSSKLGAAQHTNSSLVADEPPPATQQLGGAKRTNSLFLSDDAPPPTQQFGQSKLGVARRATKSIFDNEEASNSEVEDGELPPSTKKNRHSAARYSPVSICFTFLVS